MKAALAHGRFDLCKDLLHFFESLYRSRQTRLLRAGGGSGGFGEAADWQGRRLSSARVATPDKTALLWRPLQPSDASDSARDWPCEALLPPELSLEERALAAAALRELERTVTKALLFWIKNRLWLRLFQVAVALALDLPSWLKPHSAALTGAMMGGLIEEGSTETQLCSTDRRTEDACGVLNARRFLNVANSFALQMPPRPCWPSSSATATEKKDFFRRREEDVKAEEAEGKAAAVAAPSLELESSDIRSGLRLFCIENRQPLLCDPCARGEETAAEIRRYFLSVFEGAGLPLHALALAASNADCVAAVAVFAKSPHVQRWVELADDAAFTTGSGAAWRAAKKWLLKRASEAKRRGQQQEAGEPMSVPAD